MSKEQFWLSLTLAFTTLLFAPYVVNRILVCGLWRTFANPQDNDMAQPSWAQRAKSAHANATENLVVFAPAAIGISMINAGNAMTVMACQLYFFSRVVHYIAYTAGIPVLRTLAFFGGWGGIAILVWRLLASTL